MNRFPLFLLIVAMGVLFAQESPVSHESQEGKSVYTPISKPISIDDEARIQNEDQNTTRSGGVR